MLCQKCFFYDLKNKSCAERHTLPAESEKCYYFDPQVEISLNKAELRAIMDMLIYVTSKKDQAQNSFYDKTGRLLTHKLDCMG
jgi:hypothetical protein